MLERAGLHPEDYEALQLDFDEWIDETIGPNARQLGRDENYMYLYAFPTDMRWSRPPRKPNTSITSTATPC